MTRARTTGRMKLTACVFVFLVVSLTFTSPVLASSTYNITYDANGNRISGFGFYFEYNDFNQLERVRNGTENGTILEEYVYDHEGNRLIKREPLLSQNTYYFGRNLVRVVNSTGTFDTLYVYDEKDLVARKELWNNRTFFYHPDHLGSTTLVTNETGQVVEEITYEPYGRIFAGQAERFAYTGKELDAGTGLEYYGARYYDPVRGQFTQPDSNLPDVYDPQQLNRYAYVRNNPYKYTDPDGNAAQFAIAAAAIMGYISTLVSSPDFPQDVALLAMYTNDAMKDPGDTSKFITAGAQAAFTLMPAIPGGGTSKAVGAEAKGLLSKVGQNRQMGKAAEEAIAKDAGGILNKQPLGTSLGPRVPDVVVPQTGVAIESKVGRVSATNNIKTQIAKDVELVNRRVFESVRWVFSGSPVTGKSGPTNVLQDILDKAVKETQGRFSYEAPKVKIRWP